MHIEKLNKFLDDGLTPAQRMRKLELRLLAPTHKSKDVEE